jgi:hypothetical protein
MNLREIGIEPRRSKAWEPGHGEIIRFVTDDGDCFGFLWHSLQFGTYVAAEQVLLLQYGIGAIMITGPKTEDLWVDFCEHRVRLVKADNVDIVSVKIRLRQDKEG